MEGSTSRRRLLAGAGAALSAALAGCSGMTPFVGKREESTRTIAVEDAESLAVRVDAGDVRLRTAEREDVRVELVKQSSSVTVDLENLEFRVERPDDRLRLRGVWTGDSTLSSTPSLDLDVTFPRSVAVERAETSVGDVDVRDAEGDVEARSSTGDVDVRELDGSISAVTSTGDVTLSGIEGSVSAETSTGDVRVRDIETIAGASSQTGDVEVDVPAIEGATTISSRTGDVTAAVGDVNASLHARTNTGDVDVESVELHDATVGEKVAAGTLGDGGPDLRVETQTGDVVLNPLE